MKKKKTKTTKVKKTKSAKRRFFRKFFVIASVFLVLYALYLDRVIVNRFEARRWNLPSRVYSDAFPLYNGQNVAVGELKDRLLFLGYRPVAEQPKFYGEYRQEGSRFEIYLHSFDYPHEKFEGVSISFELNDDKIYDLKNQQSGESLSLSQLEPEIIASIFDEKMEDRTFVALDKIPEPLVRAVVAVEDERFYSHHGVDPIGILRAFLTDVIHAKLLQGGSTITQQMVKNFFLTQDRTLIRKFNEMLMAPLVEFHYSKQEILEVYLNEIYFGQRGSASVTGAQEASRLYFSKDVWQLNIDEMALLAALIKSPGMYSPFSHPENAMARRNFILDKLYENKTISKTELEQAKVRSLPKSVDKTKNAQSFYFVDFVKQQLKENFSNNILQSEGLRIFTTLDMYQQRSAENSVRKWLNQLEEQRPTLKKNAENKKYLEGALIAVHPKTGFVRAYVGGRDYSKTQFDIISLAKRQPGSSFKPFVYLTALRLQDSDHSFTLASTLKDEAVTLDTGAGKWTPQNYDNQYHGDISLRTALENSFNVATVWLAEQVGLENVVDTARMAGIETDLEPYPSLALGSFEVIPLQMIQAYTVFPNNGTQSTPISIRRVVTADGEVLEKKSLEMKQVFPPNVIFLMNKALEGVINNGTASSARAGGFAKTAAGKTGTTSDYRDSWFVGYTPDLLTLTWVGYTDNASTTLSGASGALPIWTSFMKAATAGRPDKGFLPTDDIVMMRCNGVEEYFIKGTEENGCGANGQ